MQPIFKTYNQGQEVLFPESLDQYIPSDHPVRLVSEVVDQLDISAILASYKGGGTSSFHPRMMIKVLFYAYLDNTFSSRKIEKALRGNIYFMWLSGKQFPDFRTINYFRSHRLKDHIQTLFSKIVLLLGELGMIDLSGVAYTDGTKLEANANKYTFVWRGTVEYNQGRLETKLKNVLEEIDAQIKTDSHNENAPSFDSEKVNKDQLREKVQELNKSLKESDLPEKEKKKVEKKIETIQKKDLPRLDHYERQLEVMGEDRNSYSKSDTDATFMRMKDDQLKPAYNIQISTQNQVITHCVGYQNRTDIPTYIDHLEGYHQQYNTYPSQGVADAGYGSEENYAFLEEHQIDNYVKYNWFHLEQSKKYKLDIRKVSNLYYNAQDDFYVCPMGQRMNRVESKTKSTSTGYQQDVVVYQAINCQGCPLHGACHKAKGNRKIQVNDKLEAYKQQARENLCSEQGIEHRKKRAVEPESVFGQIKQNKGFRRFSLRGLEKIELEFMLVAIGHNLQKMATWKKETQKNPTKKQNKNTDKDQNCKATDQTANKTAKNEKGATTNDNLALNSSMNNKTSRRTMSMAILLICVIAKANSKKQPKI